MKKIIFSLAALGILSVSCEETKKEAPDANATEQESVDNTTSTDNNEAVAEVKKNPPHGQPGHRCDIAVGAPLDSAPTKNNVTAQPASNTTGQGFLSNSNTNAAPAQATPQRPAQTTAAGMQGKPNPAHGQPGHRCDVKVGQPLP